MKKQVLSLALAIALALSLILPAGAAFKDAADVKYTEAVDAMTGIGAINGYTDNTLKPGATITREEAAKLVVYSILGKDAAEKLPAGETGFSDVDSGRWSAPYISYLATKKIISGKGDGTFAPISAVTGYEVGKMMLCAAGYGVKDEFTGAGWDLAVANTANKTGLFAGASDVDYSKAATREEAMMYSFNGITNISTVTLNPTTGKYDLTGNTLGKLNLGLSKTVSGGTHTWTLGGKPITTGFANKPVDIKSQVVCSTLLVQDGVATANTQYGLITAQVAKASKLTVTGTDYTINESLQDNCAFIFDPSGKGTAMLTIGSNGELSSVAVEEKEFSSDISHSHFWVYAGKLGDDYEAFFCRGNGMFLDGISDKSPVTKPSFKSIYYISYDGGAVLNMPEYQVSGRPANAGSTGMTINGKAVTFSDNTVFMDISSAASADWTGFAASDVNVVSYYNIAYHKENGVYVADMVCRTGAAPLIDMPAETEVPD